MVGFDVVAGDARFSFCINEMADGVDFLLTAAGVACPPRP
jgi:TctA family transporter